MTTKAIKFNGEVDVPDHPVVTLDHDEELPTEPKPLGRPHLDGSAPGQGTYVEVVSVSLRPAETDTLLVLGEGNKSSGVRRLIAFWRLFGEPSLLKSGEVKHG